MRRGRGLPSPQRSTSMSAFVISQAAVALAMAMAMAMGASTAHAQGAPPPVRPVAPAPAPSASISVEADVDVPIPDEAELGDEVIVVTGTRSAGTQRDSAIATRVVTRDQIEGSGAQTAAQALAMQPGVWISRGLGGAEATLHGLGGKYVLVLVDGQRQIGRVDGVLDLDRLSTAEVQQIEVVNGPSSTLYGSDALGGVINLVRRVPGEDRLHLATRYATDNSTDVAGDATFVTDRFYVSGSGQWRRAPSVDRDDSDLATTISEYDERRASLRLGHRPASGWLERTELESKYLWRDLRGVDSQSTGAVFDRHNLVEEAGARASAWFGDAKHRLSLATGATLIRDQFLYDQRGSSALDKDEETRESLLEASATYERTLAEQHRASAGLEIMREAQESPRLSREGDRTRFGMFAQDQWSVHERVTLVPAARLDADSQFGTHVTPRLAALLKINDRLEVRGSAGLGYRAPSFKELYLRFENPGAGYVVDGNPELDPETSRAVSLDVTGRPRPWLALEASAAWNQLSSQITTLAGMPGDDGTLRFSYGNIARARTLDAEAHAAFELLEARLRLEAGFAVTHARDLDTDDKLSGVPPWRAQAAARWRDDKLGLSGDAELAFTGARSYPMGATTTVTDRRLDARARVAKSFGDHLQLFFGIDNLLDEGDATLQPVAPRTGYIGLSATR
jgi:outer membrane receptor for ferrienterochelin and colicins